MKAIQNTKADFNALRQLEWIETNGLGGYASGTVSGAHSRRYHGLLVAAMHPPVGRMIVLSKLDETIVLSASDMERSKFVELSCNQYPGTVHPQGYNQLTRFERHLFPEFYYEVDGVVLKKTIAAIHEENTTVVIYEVLEGKQVVTLELLPLYACRDFHGLAHANDSILQGYAFSDGTFSTMNYNGCPSLYITVPGSVFKESKGWYYNFEYSIEQYRGLDFKEDLYTHGKFSVSLKKGEQLAVVISTHGTASRNGLELFQQEKRRRELMIEPYKPKTELQKLVLAADQFIVKRGNLKTIIAGYHWFSDWGRDTMISLPGLCLATERYEDARNILKAFANSVSQGMLPNRFPDYDEAPEYNTIDATLWFFVAVYKYYQHTNDVGFVTSVLPVLKDIVSWHDKGTRYQIHVDPSDELLYGGEPGVQLTWMDAKVGDWVVTPRHGKCVEINALWYNALTILKELLLITGNDAEAQEYTSRAVRVLKMFNEKFWNDDQENLYDYIDGEYKNEDIRPNQIYAVSLPFQLLTKDKGLKVLETVTKHLLTPRGLRSVSQNHNEYRGVYGGGVWQRDSAYHQGTVWGFLLGPYVDAMMKLGRPKQEASSLLIQFMEHLNEAGVGTASEIFDGNAPHAPRGCMAQAWSIAELLRVCIEHNVEISKKDQKA